MSEGDARFAVEVFPGRYVTPFGVPGVPTRCHVLHELSRPIDLGELAFEDEGVPLDLTRRLENSGERAGVTRVKRISPTAAALLLPRSKGHLWNFDSYDASEGLERAIANPTDQLATITSLDLTINLFVILTRKV